MEDDKRIYELTTEQETYSQGIFVQVDDSTFSNTKKMSIGAIYALINTLDAAGSFNRFASFIRLNDGSGTETKVSVADLIPLINEYAAESDIDPATAVLKINDGSGTENKITINALLTDSDVVATIESALNLDTTGISFIEDDTPVAGITVLSLNGKRQNKLQVISGQIAVSGATTPPLGGERYIKTIDDYDSPGHDIYFPYSPKIQTNENAYGRVTTNGKMYINAFNEGTWVFNITILGT